mmetsp:Transcript_2191/g.4522  ORF Transcript_2191/g.4522 Transcript_2191/m.4522 type:complete len:98 (-) Transcript_2191:153-446(-)
MPPCINSASNIDLRTLCADAHRKSELLTPSIQPVAFFCTANHDSQYAHLTPQMPIYFLSPKSLKSSFGRALPKWSTVPLTRCLLWVGGFAFPLLANF